MAIAKGCIYVGQADVAVLEDTHMYLNGWLIVYTQFVSNMWQYL